MTQENREHITHFEIDLTMKRQQKDTDDDDNEEEFQHTNHKTNDLSVTQFEYLSNEILYEIFEYLDFYDISQAFMNLNARFKDLLLAPTLPIHADCSLISKPNFNTYFTNTIIPNLHRVKSLHLSILSHTNSVLFSLDNFIELTRLETLVFDNIPRLYLFDLRYFHALPRLTSLIIIGSNYRDDQEIIYSRVFQLSTLKYFKVSLDDRRRPASNTLFTSTNITSPIEHLVIENIIHIDLLYAILSYVPHLRRLMIRSLIGSDKRNDPSLNILTEFTHFTIGLCDLPFSDFQLLAHNVLRHLRILCISTKDNRTYLEANQWEDIISASIPNLEIFDLQCSYSNAQSSELMFNDFTSPFWTDRQWFFALQHPNKQSSRSTLFYTTKPYKRTTFSLWGKIDQKTSFDSVDHLRLKSIPIISYCSNYFPNVRKLSLSHRAATVDHSMIRNLSHIIPLQQLTMLSIHDDYFLLTQLLHILRFALNVQTLRLSLGTLHRGEIAEIRRNPNFQTVSRTNRIQNVTLNMVNDYQLRVLFIILCPQLNYLTINGRFLSLSTEELL